MAETVGATGLAHIAQMLETMLRGEESALQWPVANTALVAAGQRAQVESLALAQQIDASDPREPAATSADASKLLSGLEQLRPLLASSNLAALPLYEALAREHGLAQQPEFAALVAAIDQFDFTLAVQACDARLAKFQQDAGPG